MGKTPLGQEVLLSAFPASQAGTLPAGGEGCSKAMASLSHKH